MEPNALPLSRQQRRALKRLLAKERSQFNPVPMDRLGKVWNRKQRRKWAAERRAAK